MYLHRHVLFMYIIVMYNSIYLIYVENTEVLSPPPYPSHLPSYEETLRSPSPMQLQLYNGQVFVQ